MVYIPVYCRLPNKFIKYEERRFDDKVGHSGIKRVAIFTNKKKQQCEMTAQVMWDK